MTLNTPLGKCLFAGAVFFATLQICAQPSPTSDFIRIDQFGYRPAAKKVAVIADPQTGYDASLSFAPSTAANQYQIRKTETDEVAFSGTLAAWNRQAAQEVVAGAGHGLPHTHGSAVVELLRSVLREVN